MLNNNRNILLKDGGLQYEFERDYLGLIYIKIIKGSIVRQCIDNCFSVFYPNGDKYFVRLTADFVNGLKCIKKL